MSDGAEQHQQTVGPAVAGRKDLWDKIATLTVPFVTLVVGMIGAYATYTYNQADLRQKQRQADSELEIHREQEANARLTAQAQSLEHLFTYIAAADPQKREFGYSMFAAMGQGELAARLISLKHDKAGIQVLKSLAQDKNTAVSTVAKEGLASMVNASTAGNVVLRTGSSCRDFAEGGFRVAKRLPATDKDYDAAAQDLGVEPAALRAFVKVESGNSQLADGRPTILFERTIFHRLTNGTYDTAHPGVSSATPAGYGAPGAHQYDRLTEAAKLNCPAALASTSWGAFSMTGQLYKQAGYEYVDDFVKDEISSGAKELDAAVAFLKSARLVAPLRDKDWALLARRYNGPNFASNRYDQRLADAYKEFASHSSAAASATP